MTERQPWLDALRCTACLLVILVHSAGPQFAQVQNPEAHFWGDLYGTLANSAVPLFFVLSGWLLLPIRGSSVQFLRKRLLRIAAPFAVWTVVYCIWELRRTGAPWSDLPLQLLWSLIKYPEAGLHLWFLYVLVGMYLFLPVLSPWLERVSLRGELWFLALWAVTLLLPFIRLLTPLPWGAAPWNPYGALTMFSGYIGYFVLGHFLRRLSEAGRLNGLGPWAWLGFLLTAGLSFGIQESIYSLTKAAFEPTRDILSLDVALMAAFLVVAFHAMPVRSGVLRSALAWLADMSFAIYLVHYLFVFDFLWVWYSLALPASVLILANTVLTAVLSTLVVAVLRLIPKSKWILG